MSQVPQKAEKRQLITIVVVSLIFSFLFLSLWVAFNWVAIGFLQTALKLERLEDKNDAIVRRLPGGIFKNLSKDVRLNKSVMSAKLQMRQFIESGKATSIGVIDSAHDFVPDLSEQRRDVLGPLKNSLSVLVLKLKEGMILCKLSASLIVLKFLILLSAMPLFLLLGAVGFIDGLSRREIRTAELGRESSYVFHQLNKWVFHLVFLVLFIWLSMPVALEPYWVLVPLALFFAFMLSMSVSRFKKHL